MANAVLVDPGLPDHIETIKPVRPNADFDQFVQELVREIAAELDLPIEILTRETT